MIFPAVAVVGLERTRYMVTETIGLVEVCAIVHEPTEQMELCPISFPFDVVISTTDDTAGTDYYTAASARILTCRSITQLNHLIILASLKC